MSAGDIGVGVIGLGFMGRTHLLAYEAARRAGLPCRVVAVCDMDAGARAGRSAGGNIGPGADAPAVIEHAPTYAGPAELAADPSVHAVSVCTPTDTHVDIAAMMLRAGKHVLVEKPVALETAPIEELARIAREAGRICMPAMCMRWWPGWDWLKERVCDGSLGAVRSATFTRLGSRPTWNQPFYADPTRSGGALFDLHVHDTDFVYWLFGPPDSVTSAGTIDHITTQYHYATGRGPPLVTAEGGWLTQPGLPFRMRYTVEFEQAVADWDLSHPAPDRLLVARDGRAEPVPLQREAGYVGEVRDFVSAAASGDATLRATLEDSLSVTRIIEAERRSLLERGRAPSG